MFISNNTRAGKITAQEVYDLREEYAAGATQGSLARKYKLSVGQVGRIVRGESWQSYSNPNQAGGGRYRNEEAAGKLPSPEEIAESERRLKELLDNGDSNG
jgi:hypothetical protein